MKGAFYITKRVGKFMSSTLQTADSVRIGGIHRLRLLEGILALVDKMQIYESSDKETCAIVCEFGKMQLLMAFSPDAYRGFSGEGGCLPLNKTKKTTNLKSPWFSYLTNISFN